MGVSGHGGLTVCSDQATLDGDLSMSDFSIRGGPNPPLEPIDNQVLGSQSYTLIFNCVGAGTPDPWGVQGPTVCLSHDQDTIRLFHSPPPMSAHCTFPEATKCGVCTE